MCVSNKTKKNIKSKERIFGNIVLKNKKRLIYSKKNMDSTSSLILYTFCFFILGFMKPHEAFDTDLVKIHGDESWTQFKLMHDKVYADDEEEIRRYNIWTDNYNYVKNHNKLASKKEASFTLGLNSFCDMVVFILQSKRMFFLTI